jgi:hypothetical protein
MGMRPPADRAQRAIGRTVRMPVPYATTSLSFPMRSSFVRHSGSASHDDERREEGVNAILAVVLARHAQPAYVA